MAETAATLTDAAQDARDTWETLAPHLTLSDAQKRVSLATKAAIVMVLTHPHTTLREAARAQGIEYPSITKALAKPHVLSLKKQIAKALRESWADKAVAVFADVMIHEKKAGDRMRAAEFLAGIEGVAPTKRTEIQHHGQIAPLGIVINMPVNAGISAPLDSVSGVVTAESLQMLDVTPAVEKGRMLNRQDDDE